MSLRRPTRILLCILVIVYLCSMFAGFLSPYDPALQHRDAVFVPPVQLHFGTTKEQPRGLFVYAPPTPDETAIQGAEAKPVVHRVHWLVRGARYTVLGIFEFDWHLFGVDPPAQIFLMGTDNYGRDVFSRTLFGGQISLLAGLLATILALFLGTAFGVLAGFYGGWVDSAIMRSVELFMALPWLYLLLALRALLPLDMDSRTAFLLVVLVIGLVGWARPARLIRGLVLSVRERTHLLAAQSFGATDFYLLRIHVLPETRALVLTQAAVLIPQFILAEVTLSFLGLGVGEPEPSWGGMLATLQQFHVLLFDWWMFFPGLILVGVILLYTLLSADLQGRSRIERGILSAPWVS